MQLKIINRTKKWLKFPFCEWKGSNEFNTCISRDNKQLLIVIPRDKNRRRYRGPIPQWCTVVIMSLLYPKLWLMIDFRIRIGESSLKRIESIFYFWKTRPFRIFDYDDYNFCPAFFGCRQKIKFGTDSIFDKFYRLLWCTPQKGWLRWDFSGYWFEIAIIEICNILLLD